MSGRQKTTVLILLCAVLIVFGALFRLLQTSANPPPLGTPSPFVLHTPTSTATATSTASPSGSRE
ncbi:MAG: hypothetical protein WBB22_11610, partial [Anaerolineae bacterium]